MSVTEQVKELIANGKTQEALDWLQEILKDKDATLLNQIYLLEGQYKDLVKKSQLGLQDTTPDINRVNFTLLTICDEVDKAGIAKKMVKKQADTPQNKDNSVKTASIALGVITLVVIIIILVVIYFIGKK